MLQAGIIVGIGCKNQQATLTDIHILGHHDEQPIKTMKSKSTVNKAGNYTKPTMRKRLFNRIKAGGKGGNPGQWSARKAQMLASAYKKAGGGYK